MRMLMMTKKRDSVGGMHQAERAMTRVHTQCLVSRGTMIEGEKTIHQLHAHAQPLDCATRAAFGISLGFGSRDRWSEPASQSPWPATLDYPHHQRAHTIEY